LGNRPELLVEELALLGEGPLWLPERKQIAWVDIEGKRVHFFTPSTGEKSAIDVGQRIGAAVLADDGRLVCALQNGFHFLDLNDGSLEPIADPEADMPGNRFNDGKCDPSGRFWAGTMPLADSEPTGALYRLDGDGSVHRMVTGIGCSNGLGWKPDGTVMYYIDTVTRRIDRFDYDAQTGNIANRQTVADIPDDFGFPDGMAVDAEGHLWVAFWGGYGVRRFNPETGECLEKVELPVSQVSSCCFGGENLDVLYITSARVGLSEEQLQQEPLAGSTFKYVPGVSGMPVNVYKTNG